MLGRRLWLPLQRRLHPPWTLRALFYHVIKIQVNRLRDRAGKEKNKPWSEKLALGEY